MLINQAGRNLIKTFEGCRLEAYRDSVGVWTIGYGHTSMAGPPGVARGMKISQGEADALFDADVGKFAAQVEKLIKTPLNDFQFSAIVSLAYNIGLGNLRNSSALRAINTGRLDLVPGRIQLWTKAGGRTLAGLVKRRAAEAALFVRTEMATLLSDDSIDVSPAELHEASGLNGQVEAEDIDGTLAKPVYMHRRVWGAVTALAGNAALVTAFGGWDFNKMLVFLTFATIWAGTFVFLYREEIRKALVT